MGANSLCPMDTRHDCHDTFCIKKGSGRYLDRRLQHWVRCRALPGHQVTTGVERRALCLLRVHGIGSSAIPANIKTCCLVSRSS